MTEEIIGSKWTLLLMFIVGFFAVDIFCPNSLYVRSSTAPPNPWTKQSLTTFSPHGPTSTTPWPELGTKRHQNTKTRPPNNPTNQHSNVQLSYNKPNSNPNLPQRTNDPKKSEGPHSGLALSYGIGQAVQVPKPTEKSKSNLNLNQQGVWKDSAKTQNVIGGFTQKPIVNTSSQKPSSNPSTLGPTKSTPSAPLNEDEELRQFFEGLIKKDSGNVAHLVTANYQGKTTSRSATDEAPLPLLDINQKLYETPSVSKLIALHNNYILEANTNEHVTAQERLEENDLLDTIVNTPVMQAAKNFLIEKGIVSKDPKDFRDKLKEIWFNMYSRGGGRIGSSGFEHVFLAEIKKTDVSGLHNWLYFKDAEAKGLANYLGYMRRIDLGNKGSILKYHFTFNGLDKPVGSMFIGTSPELEIALYSTCFLLKPDQVCPMRYDGKNFIVRTYTFRYRGKNMIGSAFPEI